MQQNKRQRSDGPPRDPVPKGWRQCPPMGEVSELHPFIPCKVPLGGRLGQTIEPEYQFTPEGACVMAHQKLMEFFNEKQQQTGGKWIPPWAVGRWDPNRGPFQPQLAVIIDLSNSSRYYSPMEVPQGVAYIKVPCVGRDASPDPLAVNQACWEINKALMSYPDTYFLMHCTHGFNRTGYMITCAMMRLLASTGMCVERAVRRFAAQRPPGIYKHHYIEDLFKYHHEARPGHIQTPAVPAWKGPDTPEGDEDDDGPDADGGAVRNNGAQLAPMHHDDKFGEVIPDEEREWLAHMVYDSIMGQDAHLRGGAPGPSAIQNGGPPQFAGSQPVSLDREKLEFIRRKRYWVTWKADGTRYMLLLTNWGVYLMDRACDIRRLQMRFPTALTPDRAAAFQKARAKARRPEEVPLFPVGPPHNWTLMDGEMVVDEIKEEGQEGGGGGGGEGGEVKMRRRRYLAYDLMMLNGEGVMDLKFGDRHLLVEKEVAAPRGEEARWMGALQQGRAPLVYLYTEEPFGFRRKEFYQLHRGEKLLREFIPRLCHESDGLILQPHDDPYIPRTCDDLLKWKFDYLNSVDFKLEALPGREPQLLLNYGGGRGRGGAQLNQHRPREGCRLLVKPGFDPCTYNGKIIECSYNRAEHAWEYMRERTDKTTANHISVFDKVVKSIEDDLQEGDLLAVFEAAYRERPDLYDDDIRAQQGQPPKPRAPFRPAVQYGAPQQQHYQQQQQRGPPLQQGGPGGWQQHGGGPPPGGGHHHRNHHPQQAGHFNGGGPPPQFYPPKQQQQQHQPPSGGGWGGGGGGGGPPPGLPPHGGRGSGGAAAAAAAVAAAAAKGGDDDFDPADYAPGDGSDATDDEAGDAGDAAGDYAAAGDDDDPANMGPLALGWGGDEEEFGNGEGGDGEEEDGGGEYYAATEGGELAPPPS